MLSCLHSPVLSPWTEGRLPCKLGLTETGRSQSVRAVCFWFAILNCPDCCNAALHLWGFLLLGELACAIYENHPDSYAGFEIRRSFVLLLEARGKKQKKCRHFRLSLYLCQNMSLKLHPDLKPLSKRSPINNHFIPSALPDLNADIRKWSL